MRPWKGIWGYRGIDKIRGGGGNSRKSAAKFVIVMGNLRSLCML